MAYEPKSKRRLLARVLDAVGNPKINDTTPLDLSPELMDSALL